MPEKTKLFVDCRSTHFTSTGDFSGNIYLRKERNSSVIPAALCFFNTEDGYKVINLNKNTSKDFNTLNTVFNEGNKMIRMESRFFSEKLLCFMTENDNTKD